MVDYGTNISVEGVAEVIGVLQKYEKESYNALRRELRSAISSELASIRSNVSQQEDVLRSVTNVGLFHSGRTGWGNPQIALGSSPRARGGRAILSVEERNKSGGFAIAELAGRSTSGITASGQAYIAMLRRNVQPGYAGRFLYHNTIKYLPHIRRKMLTILDKYAATINRKIEVK